MSEPLSAKIIERGEEIEIGVRDGWRDAWGTYRVTDHALHRVTSPLVPLRSTREQAELDFVHYCISRHDDPTPLRELVGRLRAERGEAYKLLHDLTPMGSEYVNNPKRCARWIEHELEKRSRMLVETHCKLNEIERERDEARRMVAVFMEAKS